MAPANLANATDDEAAGKGETAMQLRIAHNGFEAGRVIDDVTVGGQGCDMVEENMRVLIGAPEMSRTWGPGAAIIEKAARRKPREIRIVEETNVGRDEIGGAGGHAGSPKEVGAGRRISKASGTRNMGGKVVEGGRDEAVRHEMGKPLEN